LLCKDLGDPNPAREGFSAGVSLRGILETPEMPEFLKCQIASENGFIRPGDEAGA
jgi:hypothetical protein